MQEHHISGYIVEERPMNDPSMGCLWGLVKAALFVVVLLLLGAGILIGIVLASVSTVLV